MATAGKSQIVVRLPPDLEAPFRASALRHQRGLATEAEAMVRACLGVGESWYRSHPEEDYLPRGMDKRYVRTRRVQMDLPHDLAHALTLSARAHGRERTAELRAVLRTCLAAGDSWQTWPPWQPPPPAQPTGPARARARPKRPRGRPRKGDTS